MVWLWMGVLGFAGAAAVLRLVQVQVLALDRRFVLRHARMTSCHAKKDIGSCPELHHVLPGIASGYCQ